MIYENPCVYIFYLHLTMTGYFSFAAGLMSRCRTGSVDNVLWPVEHNLINEYGLRRVGVSSVCLCGDFFLCACRIGQIWTRRSLFMYRYCYTIPVYDMFIERAKQWSMTVRLPSLSIKQVIQNVILQAEKYLSCVVRNIILIFYGLVVLCIFTG